MGTHREGDWSVGGGGGKQPEKSEQSVKKREGGGDLLQGLHNGAEHQKIERQQKKKSPKKPT